MPRPAVKTSATLCRVLETQIRRSAPARSSDAARAARLAPASSHRPLRTQDSASAKFSELMMTSAVFHPPRRARTAWFSRR